jgi:hypothetical protein
VLYDMRVGDPPYGGSTAQAVLGKIIQARAHGLDARAMGRSLTAGSADDADVPPLVLMKNFAEELRQRVPR